MSRKIVMFASADVTVCPRIAKQAEALVVDGWETVVLAWDRAGIHPPTLDMGSWRIENMGPLAAHGAGLRNVTGYLTYWRSAARRAREIDADVLHCVNLDTVPVALRVLRSSRRRLRWVLDFHEIYRESKALPQRGLAGLVARSAARYLERRSIPKADVVITVLEGQVFYYEDLGARNVVVVENAPDPEHYAVSERREPEFVVSFIGQKRWIPSLLNLMKAVQPHREMHALLIGGGPAEAEVERLASTFERVEVSGRVEPSEIPRLYQRCDAVYACYDNSLLNWRTSLPVKAMEGMASGLPIIVTKDSWIGDYVELHQVGIAVDDRDPADVERALVTLSEDRALCRALGRRGRELIETQLNWQAAAGRLRAAYQALGISRVPDDSAHSES